MSFKSQLPLLLVLLYSFLSQTVGADIPECQSITEFNERTPDEQPYSDALLWELSKPGIPVSYIFGTIHVSDESIIPEQLRVQSALMKSQTFIMEVIPDSINLLPHMEKMYFSADEKLSAIVSSGLFQRLVEILNPYHLSPDSVDRMKPWLAYLTMSYPPDFGVVMDIRLLEKARQNGLRLTGLETLEEQLDLFSQLTIDDQLVLLADTACNYDNLTNDFDKMKELYSKQDIDGLYRHSYRYDFDKVPLYRELMDKILSQRNARMVERMTDTLQKGGAFVAIGALHLPGSDGVLARLKQQSFEVRPVLQDIK